METLVNQLEGSLLVLAMLAAIGFYLVWDEMRTFKEKVKLIIQWDEQAYKLLEWLTDRMKDHDTQLQDHEDQLQGLEERVGGVDEVVEDETVEEEEKCRCLHGCKAVDTDVTETIAKVWKQVEEEKSVEDEANCPKSRCAGGVEINIKAQIDAAMRESSKRMVENTPLTYEGWKQAEEERKQRMKELNHDV